MTEPSLDIVTCSPNTPVLPPSLIRSCKNFSNEDISKISSAAGSEASIVYFKLTRLGAFLLAFFTADEDEDEGADEADLADLEGTEPAPTPAPAPAPGCNGKLPQSTTLPAGYNAQVLGNPFTQAPAVTCGTATSSCVVCAPSSPLVSGTFTISSGCTTAPKGANYGGYGYGSTTFAWGANESLSVIVKTAPGGGYIKYEFCDQNNAYGRWVLFY